MSNADGPWIQNNSQSHTSNLDVGSEAEALAGSPSQYGNNTFYLFTCRFRVKTHNFYSGARINLGPPSIYSEKLFCEL